MKTGSKSVNLPAYHDVRILATEPVSVVLQKLDEQTGELFDYAIIGSQDTEIEFSTKDDSVDIRVVCDTGTLWDIDVVDRDPYDKSDPIPVELPEDARIPETLEEKMRRFMRHALLERFGEDSREMETFEESMDFDVPEEDEPLSGFEVNDLTPEEPEDIPEGKGKGTEQETPTESPVDSEDEKPAPSKTVESTETDKTSARVSKKRKA